ncbi:maltokinase N-terminal cap-like domain-containing protein [Streptomyces nitrosporeus]|uniref:maltokinase N-terminal cap-like domain-containing protein n=1 Tax=Streptomyces nitrosporeus TaxID=28894 RepID=UPI0039A39D27
MAVIHRTTMTPGKLELLAGWLPARPWYTGAGAPELARAGGFRLDDPQGEVGLEFMVVTDTSGELPVSYHVPVTYRGAPLDGAEQALVGTSEHGVLGRRWVYDGAHDPVLLAQVLALFQGRAEPQDQNLSDTPDRTVTASRPGTGHPVITSATARDGAQGTTVTLTTADRDGEGTSSATLAVTRVLRPDPEDPSAGGAEAGGRITAGWRSPDGAVVRGPFFVLTG